MLEDFYRAKGKPKKALIIPPDYTRLHSGAGYLACACYSELKDFCRVDVLPALGTHAPMTAEEISEMYPAIPPERFIVHDWRRDVVRLGELSGEYISEISEGLLSEPIDVEVNRLLTGGGYDLILSIGQVVPHEVAGMANHAKNLFVGVGGASMINKSHMLGAIYGMERMMGRLDTPVRRVFDRAYELFLGGKPIIFMLTTATAGCIRGLFIGDTRDVLDEAALSAQKYNIDRLDRPIKKCVVFLDPGEFKSTWLGNKAIYRTRMAIADGGELLVLAPGVVRFGEDAAVDALIRKYGYRGREYMLNALNNNADLRGNMSAAAHLIHGSTDGRFRVTYAVDYNKISPREIEGAGYGVMDYYEAAGRYDVDKLKYGWNEVRGEEVFYIPNPALGLWKAEV
jgi:nickel-dependent lactate racemase